MKPKTRKSCRTRVSVSSTDSGCSETYESPEPVQANQRLLSGPKISILDMLKGHDSNILETLMSGGHRKGVSDSQCPYISIVKEPVGFVGSLKDYQIEALTWLANLYVRGLNGILADEMGLGKTIQTIALLLHLREYHNVNGLHLILAPKSTLGNWFNEFSRFAPSIKCLVFIGNRNEREQLVKEFDKHDVLITSYEMALNERRVLRTLKIVYLIIDEAHRIKNDESQLSLTSRTFEASYRLLLTGTPLQNRLRELWALLNFLFPAVFHSSDEFEAIFNSDSGDTQKQQELVKGFHRILRPFMLRREKDMVLINLPSKRESLIYVPLSGLQKQLYKRLLARNTEDGSDQKTRLMNLCIQLRKCCNHPYLIQGVEDKSRDPFGEHLITNSGKLFFLDKLLQRLIPEGNKVLIFSQMVRMLDILDDYCRIRGFEYCRLDGSTVNRDEQIERFQYTPIFLLSTRAGGLGINLTQASVVVLYDIDWNPQQDLQAIDRAHRIGQTKSVLVYRLIHEYTVEQNMLERATLKLQLDETLINKGQFGFRKVTDQIGREDLKDMVTKNLSKISFTDMGSLEALRESDVDRILSAGEERSDQLQIKWKSRVKMQPYDFSQMNVTKGTKSLLNLFESNVEVDNQADLSAWDSVVGKSETSILKRRRLSNSSGVLDDMRKYTQLSKVTVYPWQFIDQQELSRIDNELNPLIEEIKYRNRIGTHTEEAVHDLVNRKEALLNSGFYKWQRNDYYSFLRHLQAHGGEHLDILQRQLHSDINIDEVHKYYEVFSKRYNELPDSKAIQNRLKKFETDRARKEQMKGLIEWKINSSTKPKRIARSAADEDQWFIHYLHMLSYAGDWDLYKLHMRSSNMFKFDWSFQMITRGSALRRFENIKKMIQKEIEISKRK